MTGTLLTVFVGLGAGLLSGAFGVGGGVVTTPAIRLVLGYPELIAVGTPLPVILPAAFVGAMTHARNGTASVRSGLAVGAWGAPAAVAGAIASRAAGGTVVLLITAGLIVLVAIDMLRASPGAMSEHGDTRRTWRGWASLGISAGLYSGFLGLGGGFILVPALYRVFGFRLKEAIGTSLVAVAVFSIPGAMTHWAIGHVDVPLALALTVGAAPGAFLGARLTSVARENHVRLVFALFLAVVAVLLALNETGVL